MVESMSAREGTVRLQLNPMLHAELEQVLLVQEGMEFDLVHGGWNRRCREQPFEVADRLVADAERAGQPLRLDLQQRLPPFGLPAPYRPGGSAPHDLA